MTIHVFSGPTVPAARVREILPDAVPHPPVRHGDLMRLGAGPGDTVLISDGLWHQSAPVRHKEILALLAEGVAVVGAASMGPCGPPSSPRTAWSASGASSRTSAAAPWTRTTKSPCSTPTTVARCPKPS